LSGSQLAIHDARKEPSDRKYITKWKASRMIHDLI
jgi:hypothetical protein